MEKGRSTTGARDVVELLFGELLFGLFRIILLNHPRFICIECEERTRKMARFDLVTTNAAIDRLLDVTDEPRHRFMLQACGDHRYLQIAGRYQEIFGLGGTPWQRTYHMQTGRSGVNLKKPNNLKGLLRSWAETNQSVFYVDAEAI